MRSGGARRDKPVTRGNKHSNLPNAARVRDELAREKRRRRGLLMRRAAAGLAACALLGGGAALLLDRGGPPKPTPTPVSSVDANARACVLSGPGDASLAVVDAGLQQVAKADGHLNVQNYPLPGTATDATPFLNGMIASRCGVVIGIGDLAGRAIASYPANGHPAAKLIVVGAATTQTTDVAFLSPAGLTAAGVAAQVRADLS
jgi:hypothetical protein